MTERGLRERSPPRLGEKTMDDYQKALRRGRCGESRGADTAASLTIGCELLKNGIDVLIEEAQS